MLKGVRVKIDRAKKHLADLSASIDAFKAREGHFIALEKAPHITTETYRFHERETIPDQWGAIIGDCVHNLRSALDHLATVLVIQNGETPTNNTSFPIGRDRTNFLSNGLQQIKGVSADALAVIKRLKPYDGGNDTLFRLHQLDIVDKHRLLILVAADFSRFSLKIDIRTPGTDHYPPARWLSGPPLTDRKFPLEDGDELLTYARFPGDDKSEFKFTLEIAFGKGQVFDRQAVIPTLTQLVDFTERLIDIFARRILRTDW